MAHPSIMGGLFRIYSMLGGGIANTRSLPATHRLYNPSSLDIPDAADGLADKTNLPASATGTGVLLTADGGRYLGELFGAQAIGSGELVFTTGMMGYQESLTDPSFAGQVLTFTYPLIGNYGVHIGASESSKVWPKGVVVRHAMHQPDHRHAAGTVDEFLRLHGVPGIHNIDTRAITRRVRELGTVLCVFGPVEREKDLEAKLQALTSPELEDLVDEVSIDEPIELNKGSLDELGGKKPRLGVLDCGVKYNILRHLCMVFDVVWCPPDIAYETLRDTYAIDALFCSNGPGDPAHPGKATDARNTLARAVPERGAGPSGVA